MSKKRRDRRRRRKGQLLNTRKTNLPRIQESLVRLPMGHSAEMPIANVDTNRRPVEREKRKLNDYELTLFQGALGLTSAAFVAVGYRSFIETYDSGFLIRYGATFCLFLLYILRYLVITSLYHTERTLCAWITSILVSLVGPLAVWLSWYGTSWFACTSMLYLLAALKCEQSKPAIRRNNKIPVDRKAELLHHQDDLIGWEIALSLAMYAFYWLASDEGGSFAASFLAVSDASQWRQGILLTGSTVGLCANALLSFRLAMRHYRDMLASPAGDTTPQS